ncbi:MAG TPA: BTAD domain-containing putative transcriptional regulator [Trebonia sp.]|nr:BTAD domain-containing putative transcriptional regulator [Trebonia sp.]
MVEFRVLGPVRVERAGQEVAIGRRRERCLLGILLLEAGHPVPKARLTDLLWDGDPPANARAALRTHLSRLRALLDTDGEPGLELVHTAGGYAALVEPQVVDALRFRDLVKQARGIAEPTERAEVLRRAVRLWRGPLLADAASDWVRERLEAPWAEARLAAVEDAIDAELASGRERELVGELNALCAEYPHRERFTALLMLALYRDGRQGEALTAFARHDAVVRGELGLDPGPELRELQQRILTADPALLAGRTPSLPAAPADRPGRSGPRQLPATVRHFAGRAPELKALRELLAQSPHGGAVVISAISGTAGVGKTALAIHFAHQAAERFPDGQLYVNLRGFDPSGAVVSPSDVFPGFLDALGVPAQRIPADLDEQTALYRSVMADRCVLVLLDNARDAGQVRPLLPASSGCLVLITSRDQLGALVALDGAVPLTLGLLTQDEARDLLSRRLGQERVLADEPAVTELIDLCARLPLALNIAAAHAALHPALPLSALADELRDTRHRLDILTLGTGMADVRAVLSWSYDTLSPEAARVFRLLGLHSGADISLAAVAGLTDRDAKQARRALDELATAHLITASTAGRYGFHDLLRSYAAEQVQALDTETERAEALRRVCDFYIHTASGADRILEPNRMQVELDPPGRGSRPLPLTDATAAMAWFDAEHANVLAAQRSAAERGWHQAVFEMAWTLFAFQRHRGLRHAQLAACQAALTAVGHLRDHATEIHVHRLLGRAYVSHGRHEEALAHLDQALALADQHGSVTERANSELALSFAHARLGQDQRALGHAERALDFFSTLESPSWQAAAHNAVGWCAARLGDYDTGRIHCQKALDLLYRHEQDPDTQADVLDSLAYIEHHTGHQREAIDYYRQALALRRSLSHVSATAIMLERLGHPQAELGQHDEARAAWREALTLYRELGYTEDAERVERQLDALDRTGNGTTRAGT